MNWVALIWSMGAGACLTLALMHLAVRWKDRAAQANPIVTVMLKLFSTEYKGFPDGIAGIIMEAGVGEYRYVRGRILRLLAYRNRDIDVGSAIRGTLFS